MGARMLGAIFAAIVLNFSSAALEADNSYQFKWYKESNYNCQSLSGRGSELLIGEDDRAFDSGVTVKFCKDKCAQNDGCQGFDFIDLGGSRPPVCRYQQNIDSDTLTSEATANCYIYGRPSVVELTPPPTVPSTCANPTGCLKSSCDDHIRMSTRPVTCDSLETLLDCNCDKCLCETATTAAVTTTSPRPPTTSTRPASVTFQFQWSVLAGHDCISGLDSTLHIGSDNGPDGQPKGFDLLDLQSCKEKCASNAECQGFNYDNARGVCRYKKSLSHAKSIPKDSGDCYVYDRDGSKPTIQTGTRITMPASTTPTYKYRWLREKNVDCSVTVNSQSLTIGDTSDSGIRLTYDTASIEKCQRKCAEYIMCNGFNYEFELGRCNYKSGIKHDISQRAAHHDCYLYERPQNKTSSADKCDEKTTCIRNSCDYHIAHTPGLTCDKLTLFGCNCNGCECREPPTTTRPRAAPVSYKFEWRKFDNYQCLGDLRLFPNGSSLDIGRGKRAFDEGITPEKCKNVCANNEHCMGFNYDALLSSGTCHYKAALDKAEILRPFPNRSCYVYMAGEVLPTRQKTTPSPPRTTCTAPTSCQRVSCDDWMRHHRGVTCDLLENQLNCNCDGCNCRNAVSTTTTPPLPASWKVMKGHSCESSPLSALFIGQEKDGAGRPKAYDKFPLEDCKNKCMRNDKCKGFNYDNSQGVCRYKQSLSHAKAIVRTAEDCWIYDKDGAREVPEGTIPPATSPRISEYRWSMTEKHDCTSENTRELHIGDSRDRSGVSASYDINSVDYCKNKCAQFVKCYGFNYEFERGSCRYLAGASGARPMRKADIYNCYVYLRPTITTAERPRPTRPERDGRVTRGSDGVTRRSDGRVTRGSDGVTRGSERDGGDTRPSRTPEPPTLDIEWNSKRNGVCEATETQALFIGEGRQDYDIQSVTLCKRKCERDRQCDGFNYETGRGVCKYQSGISIDTRTRDSVFTDCYVIVREKATTPTTRQTRPNRDGTPTTRATNDQNSNPTTVEQPTPRPTAATTTTSAATKSSAKQWAMMEGYFCASKSLLSNLRIGSGLEDDGYTHQAYDKLSTEECKDKCARNVLCRGFNYNRDMGICHYKKSLSGANAKPTEDNDCYIYDEFLATTISTGSTYSVPTEPTTPVPTPDTTNPPTTIPTRGHVTRRTIPTRRPIAAQTTQPTATRPNAAQTTQTPVPNMTPIAVSAPADTQNNNINPTAAPSGSGGVVAAAVIGTLIALAAVVGAVVGVICFLRKNKDVYVESYHNANNLASGNNDL